MGEGWNAWLVEKGQILGSEGLIDRGQFECPNSPRRGVASDQDRSILYQRVKYLIFWLLRQLSTKDGNNNPSF